MIANFDSYSLPLPTLSNEPIPSLVISFSPRIFISTPYFSSEAAFLAISGGVITFGGSVTRFLVIVTPSATATTLG